MDDAEYDRERTRLTNEIKVLRAKVAETEERAMHWLELTEKAFEFVCEARNAFLRGNWEVRRSILKAIGLNWRLKDHELRIEAKEWLIPIAEKKDLVQVEIESFELVKNIQNIQDLQGQLWASDSMLSRLRE